MAIFQSQRLLLSQRQLLTLKHQPSSNFIITSHQPLKDPPLIGKTSPTVSTPPATSSSLPPFIFNVGLPSSVSNLPQKQILLQGPPPFALGGSTNTTPTLLQMTSSSGESAKDIFNQTAQPTLVNEFLKVDFVSAADEWFSYVGNANKSKNKTFMKIFLLTTN